LASIALVSGTALLDVSARFHAFVDDEATPADEHEVEEHLLELVRRVQLAPIPFDAKQPVIGALRGQLACPPKLSRSDLAAWRSLTRDLPADIVQIDRNPVVLPAMATEQEAAWHAILDLDAGLDAHWCLIGGQMVTLLCAEHEHTVHRPTDDGDIVLGVWLRRDALKQTSRLLDESGFIEDATHDGYGYRYRRGDASIDLLLPEEIRRQEQIPTTATGRRGLEVPGGNQALIRAERVPVQLGERTGYVRRPNLLGALVAKAAASVADNRDADRHRDDIAVLARISLTAGQLRQMRRMTNDKDRRRLRLALNDMPESHRSWRLIDDPNDVRTALVRLSEA
jgi:hypothetical protein